MAAPRQSQPKLEYASDESDPSDIELEDDDDVERWMVTESAMNRWSRFPAEAQRYVDRCYYRRHKLIKGSSILKVPSWTDHRTIPKSCLSVTLPSP